MNGSEAMVATLLNNDVDVCFANPGTSEMHFVSALDRKPEMRCILGLFEGVVTGAADGYYRMSGKPAATLLHLGSGLGNGLANLHNAKRARSGIVNIVGDHALDHLANDAPLASDVAGIAKPVSDWVRTTMSSELVPDDTAEAIVQASGTPGKIATLILPADAAWGPCSKGGASRKEPLPASRAADETIEKIAQILRGADPKRTALLLGGTAMRSKTTRLAGQIAAKTGCQLLSEVKNARSTRGVGHVNVPQIPYPIDTALKTLEGIDQLILIGASKPVATFAYPGKPRFLTHPDCQIHTAATPEQNTHATLQAVCDALETDAKSVSYISQANALQRWSPGKPNSLDLGRAIAAHIPENAIVVDEAITTGRQFFESSILAAPHDWLEITGGAIGYGLPTAVGAAIACPDRKVIAVEGDGCAMYTLQSLWTMAREGLDVTVIICANRTYQILRGELAAMGGPAPGVNANRMFSIDDPTIEWTGLAKSLGLEAVSVDNMNDVASALQRAMQIKGPNLIEVVM